MRSYLGEFATKRDVSPSHSRCSSGHGSYEQPSFAVIPVTKSRAFTARSHREPNDRFQWHYHPEWEITFTRSGRGTRHVGSSVEQFGPGDLTLLPANVPHTWFSSAEHTDETHRTMVHFLPHVWGPDFWSLPEMADFQELCQRARGGVRFTGPGVEEVGRRMEALALNDAPSLGSISSLLNIFSLLPKLENRSLNAVAESRPGWQNARLTELLAWIDERHTESITQQEAAARVNMSPAAFSRWFKGHMGCVFLRYLNEIKVAKVCGEIANGKVSITEAAFNAGYNNLSNFNRRFLEITGLTPKAFRTQIQSRL